MKIGFIGCGAIGSCYASYLISKHEVCVLDTYQPVIDAVKENGILVDKNAPGHGNGETISVRPAIATTDPRRSACATWWSCSSTISTLRPPCATPCRCSTTTP